MTKKTAKPAGRGRGGADIAYQMGDFIMSPPEYDMSHLRYRRDVYGNTVLDEDDQEDGEDSPKAAKNPA